MNHTRASENIAKHKSETLTSVHNHRLKSWGSQRSPLFGWPTASDFLLDENGPSSGIGSERTGASGWEQGEGGGEFSGSRRGTCRREVDWQMGGRKWGRLSLLWLAAVSCSPVNPLHLDTNSRCWLFVVTELFSRLSAIPRLCNHSESLASSSLSVCDGTTYFCFPVQSTL